MLQYSTHLRMRLIVHVRISLSFKKKVWFQKFHAYVYRFFSHPYILKCLSSRLIVIQRDGFQREKHLRHTVDASWLTTYIEAFRQNLISDSQKDGTINLIPPEQVNIFVLRAVRDLLFYSVNIVKYFSDLDRAKNLFAMSRAEEFFDIFR